MEASADCINRPGVVAGPSVVASPPPRSSHRVGLVASGPAGTTFEVTLPLR